MKEGNYDRHENEGKEGDERIEWQNLLQFSGAPGRLPKVFRLRVLLPP